MPRRCLSIRSSFWGIFRVTWPIRAPSHLLPTERFGLRTPRRHASIVFLFRHSPAATRPRARLPGKTAARVTTFPLVRLSSTYLAGFAASTALVFEPAEHALWHVAPSGTYRLVPLDGELPAVGGLRYAAARDSVVAVKVVADDFDGYMALLHVESGEILSQTPLEGPAWQHAGLLRLREPDVISLSAYMPRALTWAPGTVEPTSAAPPGADTLRFFGFDSPMLARMRQFMQGDTHAPPMLSVSAAVTASRFYVINMRPGWLRLDVYDREGRLLHVLTEPRPAFNKDFYPTDIAVREEERGRVTMAIAVLEPEPGVRFFRWEDPVGIPESPAVDQQP